MTAVIDRPEILAPAGDRERLEAAITFGADAVYLAGKSYGMRSSSANFDENGLRAAVRRAHADGVRVYVTCNTLPREDELAGLPAFLELVDDTGADALILADLGAMALAERYAPHCRRHVSTQCGVMNAQTARVLYEMGASRVVLARELSLREITGIRAQAPADLELEAFVHGSMCMAYSGRCLLSAYLTGRSANGGDCTQPCRWAYELLEPTRPGQPMTVEEEGGETFLFNANDLCMIEHVAALAQAGVASFKIEGRAKAAYYTAVVTHAYRQAVEGYAAAGGPPDYRPSRWIVEEVEKVSHRPYGTGFYFGQPAQDTVSGGYQRTYEVAAVVRGYMDGRVQLVQRNRFRRGDPLEVLEPGRPPFPLSVTALFDGDGQAIDQANHAAQALQIPYDRPLTPGSLLRRRVDGA